MARISENGLKYVVIAGGGPAGLTAAYELASRSSEYVPLVYEASDMLGGISCTICHNGNRIDIGGHRFFSKSQRVNDFWTRVMPLQSAPALDESLLHTDKVYQGQGSDPESVDNVMLMRRRVSRIYYLNKFFDYPVTLSWATLKGMGFKRTLEAGMGFVWSRLRPLPEISLENFYVNRFGRPLYSMFFEGYTEKVWGIHPSKFGADWGAQRVKGLSITAILKDMLAKSLGTKPTNKEVETSLIEEFVYPKYGPGQFWETVGREVQALGGRICLNSRIESVYVRDGKVESVVVRDANGELRRQPCDVLVSSMPVKELIGMTRGIDIPENVREVASSLPYRDFITVGLLVDRLKIRNQTKLASYANRVPDTWIYVQEPQVKLGRIQIFNNWSPYMVKDFKDTMWLGLEYFSNEGDELWSMSDRDFIDFAIEELVSIGIIDRDAVKDTVRIRVPKAYPAYHGSYNDFRCVRTFLDSIDNLYCVGRNGQHRYNNMDHSMLTAMKTADAIMGGCNDHAPIWEVNTETSYHEEKADKK